MAAKVGRILDDLGGCARSDLVGSIIGGAAGAVTGAING
jgi:hypothetical protein